MDSTPAKRLPRPVHPRARLQDLMRHRVHHILLVSSLYDSFVLVEDGQINRAILDEFAKLNLSANPHVTLVTSGQRALAFLDEGWRVDLIVSSPQLEDMHVFELAQEARQRGLHIPIVALLFKARDVDAFRRMQDRALINRVFLWQGDFRILLAIVKDLEDRQNVAFDTGKAGVPALIVVEDNIRFYSSFLPTIYTELVNHTQGLLREGVSLAQKLLRMRARPKVLLCETFEKAWGYFLRFEEHIQGLVSDIEFPRGGELDREAGVQLARQMRKRRPDLPVVLQSSVAQNSELARSIDAAFLLKGSPTLLEELRHLFVHTMGFGDFVFREPEGGEVGRATDLHSLILEIDNVSDKSLAYHAKHNHFSSWLKARGEFSVARDLRPRSVDDYASIDEMRRDLVDSLTRYRDDRDRTVVADYSRDAAASPSSMARIGGGSIGGKARGLAFINRLLHDYDVALRLPDVAIRIPRSVVVGSDVFDDFLDQGNLRHFAISTSNEKEVEKRFLEAEFPVEATLDLESYLENHEHPLAVRSSGLLEDSIAQPFAGIYRTFMLPNDDPDLEVRLEQLLCAVKLVYASTFSRQAKEFMRMTGFRLEEEKMPVIVQEVIGRTHEDRFYPDIGGVARSHNFYSLPPHKAEDGVVAVALGLGQQVVDGGACMRFCPHYPQHQIEFSTVEDVLRNAQRTFLALRLHQGAETRDGIEALLHAYDLDVAEKDGTLSAVASTYDHQNRRVYDGVARQGVRLVTFAPILKHGLYPVAELFEIVLGLGVEGTHGPVEIEFAINLPRSPGERLEFGFLQMRPLAVAAEQDVVEIGEWPEERVLCRSNSILGNGRQSEIHDVVVVDKARFERSRSLEAAQDVAKFNRTLVEEDRPYLLIGVGRWGSTDPYLGIPVAWNQISGVRVIVESGFKDMAVTPSQGTHFFQNLVARSVGYFTLSDAHSSRDRIDWEWLAAQPAHQETKQVRHLRFDRPLEVRMDGRHQSGIILKPASE